MTGRYIATRRHGETHAEALHRNALRNMSFDTRILLASLARIEALLTIIARSNPELDMSNIADEVDRIMRRQTESTL